MGYYANQKTIKINKPQLNKDDIRIILKKDTVEAAAKVLTGNEFKLYIYFASNSDGYNLDFSPKHFEKIYGITAETTRKLMKQLESKGFLIQKDNSSLFDFYLSPQEEYEFVEERRLIKTVKGELKAITYDELYEKFKTKRSEEEIKSYWTKLPVEEVK